MQISTTSTPSPRWGAMETTDPLYDVIGSGYDTTRRADPFITETLARELKLGDGDYLDLACGTGNYTVALAARGGRWSGVDQSATMIEAARGKSASVRWELGDVEQLPFEDRSFSGASCVLAIHHFRSLDAAFAETARVLGDGRFVLFTSAPEQTERYWLRHYFPRAVAASAAQMPSLDAVASALERASFRTVSVIPYDVQPDLQDFFLYSGKYRPEIYLDPHIRRGISAFATLADPAEIRDGCARLKSDIESGGITEVMEEHRGDAGDYCFVVAEREHRR